MRDLLAAAHGSEIDWELAAFMLRGQPPGSAPFVYFIGEENDGPIKIGRAGNPIKRLRGLQTGNPRRLRIERVIFGDLETEAFLHRVWKEHVIGGKKRSSLLNATHALETEWFAAEVREEILGVALTIALAQKDAPPDADLHAMHEIAVETITGLNYDLREQDKVRLLGRSAGYMTAKLR